MLKSNQNNVMRNSRKIVKNLSDLTSRLGLSKRPRSVEAKYFDIQGFLTFIDNGVRHFSEKIKSGNSPLGSIPDLIMGISKM